MRNALASLWNMLIALFGAGEEIAEGLRSGAKIVRSEIEHTGAEMEADRKAAIEAKAKLLEA